MWELPKVCRVLLSVGAVLLVSCQQLGPGWRVKDEMEPLLQYLDSDAYERSVPWEVHVVMAYQAAAGRLPSLAEYAVLEGLREHPGLKRSEVLGLAMPGDTDDERLESCKRMLTTKAAADFVPEDDDLRAARQLADATPAMVASVLDDVDNSPAEAEEPRPDKTKQDGPGESYNVYFGYLHAHSHLSLDADQFGTAKDAYDGARAAGLDFFSLSDHAEYLALWPWEHKYEELKSAAEASNVPGQFAALYGFEWSNPLLGHMSILNTTDFTHTLKNFRVRGVFDWIAARPAAFAQFNHPGDYDYLGLEFRHFAPYAKVANQMVGLETWNESFGLDDYFYDGGYETGPSFLDEANRKGWRLGALGAQDNHHSDWGESNNFRTGVQAKELTREAIIAAYRARRFYSTEDKDLLMDFRCNGFPMGAVLTDIAEPAFTVTLGDRSGDEFQQVRLYRDGVLLQSADVNGNEVTVEFEDATAKGGTRGHYYYVMATQTDDNDNNERNDEALSSPIWID